MNITEVRCHLVSANPSAQDHLKAVASVVFDNCFVVHGVKIIENQNGLLVAMPSRPLHDRCDRCQSKTALTHRFCHHCGNKLRERRAVPDPSGRICLFEDEAHPTNKQFRLVLTDAVCREYDRVLASAKVVSHD